MNTNLAFFGDVMSIYNKILRADATVSADIAAINTALLTTEQKTLVDTVEDRLIGLVLNGPETVDRDFVVAVTAGTDLFDAEFLALGAKFQAGTVVAQDVVDALAANRTFTSDSRALVFYRLLCDVAIQLSDPNLIETVLNKIHTITAA